jgi:hypothetical protein
MVRCLLKPSPNALIGRSNWHFGIESGHDQGGVELENSSDSDQEPDHALVTTPNGTSMNRLFLSSQDRANKPLQQRSQINSNLITSNQDQMLYLNL